MHKVFIIAEAGVNHNGSLQVAKKLIEVAAQSGANAVKFQTFRAGDLLTNNALKADYQKKYTPKNQSQRDMISLLELDEYAHRVLIEHCRKHKIIFLSSPFDLKSIDLLVKLGLKIFKIPSGEITNLPFLAKLGKLNKKVIMSTGMADLDEIGSAMDVLLKAGTKKSNITLLHCTTDYPAKFKDVNLLAMVSLRNKFKVNIGYSDHTLGVEVPVAAVALGARVIEKHFSLSKKMQGPDHKASLEPYELEIMVKSIRNIEGALGDGVKRPLRSEKNNISIVRKSIVAVRPIRKGEFFSEHNITVKRPGFGISPMKWDDILGRRAKKNFKKDQMIEK